MVGFFSLPALLDFFHKRFNIWWINCLLLFALILFSCGGESNDPLYFPSLTLKNSYDELVFTQVSLPEYNFTANNSDVQTFNLTNGISSMSNVKVTINYECMSRTGSSDVLVNFYEGQTTIIETNNINKTSLGCTPQYIVKYE